MNSSLQAGFLRCFLFYAYCVLASTVFAQTEFDQAISDTAQRWKSSGRAILDDAGMMSDGVRQDLETLLVRFQRQTGVAVAVVTLPGMKGGQLEDFTNRLYEAVGLGTAGQDSGVLLLVAQEERKIRIETGYGAEGALTDLEAKRIIDGIITPAFKAGNYSDGIAAGVEAILNEVTPGFVSDPSIRSSPGRNSDWVGKLFFIILLMLVLGLRTLRPFRRRRHLSRRGLWLGGSGGFGRGGGFSGGGGGFGGFGGGMSGGGGASGGW